jgi:hypothetical protein
MKKFLLACSAVLLIAGLQAQNIVLDPSSATEEGEPSEIVDIHIQLTNNGEDQMMTWKRTVNDIPDGWKTSVCDFTLCWLYTADEPGAPFVVPADTTGTVYVKFDARNIVGAEDLEDIPGCGYVEVVYYSISDSLNYSATGMFEAKLGVDEDCQVDVYSSAMDNSFHVYPNPAVDVIQAIASTSAKITRLELVNIVGRTVKSVEWAPVAGKMSIDVSGLPEGIYFAMFINQTNKVLFTEKIALTSK